MLICICIHLYICIYLYIYLPFPLQILMQASAGITETRWVQPTLYIYTHICIYVNIYTYSFIYVSVYICIHIDISGVTHTSSPPTDVDAGIRWNHRDSLGTTHALYIHICNIYVKMYMYSFIYRYIYISMHLYYTRTFAISSLSYRS